MLDGPLEKLKPVCEKKSPDIKKNISNSSSPDYNWCFSRNLEKR